MNNRKIRFKDKLHVHAYIILFNALLAIGIACRYFEFLPELPTDTLGITYLVASVFGQMTLIVALIGLVTIPLLVIGNNGVRHFIFAIITSFGVATLFIDTIVFAQYRFHINAVVLELVMSGQVVSFPLITWLMVIGSLCVLVAVEYGLIYWVEKRKVYKSGLGRTFAFLAFVSLLLTHGIHIWGVAYAYQPVTQITRYLPLFYPATANKFMRKHGWIDEEAIQQQKAMKLNVKSDLNYPRDALQTKPVEKPVNIMILAVDSLRYDSYTPEVMPNLWDYAQAKDAISFTNHLSSGNATRAGIFGMFYGIPSTYWHAFLAIQKTPVLMDRLQELDYQIGLFTAAYLHSPEFHQTVFAKIENLRDGSGDVGGPAERDLKLTEDWLAWYDKRDKSKPAFSFLFYDAPHGYDMPDDYPRVFQPMKEHINYLELDNNTDMTPYMNLYKTSVHFSDSQIKIVLDKLKESGDLDNTIVIVTGDHGQELNDNKLNFWGHNGNFTDVQIKVPFLVFGGGVTSKDMKFNPDSLTSHLDVPPTLLKNYLGVENPIDDYSVGVDLLGDEPNRSFVISSKYSGYAIVTNDSILEVMGSGQYEYMDKTNRAFKDDRKPDMNNLQGALDQVGMFYK